MTSSPDQSPPLGIIAGSGALPLHIAKRTKATGRDVFIAAIDGVADQEVEQFPHAWIKWGQIDKLFRELKKAGVKELVIIGGVRRPKLENIHFDFGFIRNLPFVLKLTMGGDDSILSNIVKFVEDRGITIIGAHEVAPELMAPVGVLTKNKPNQKDIIDIKKGIKTVLDLGTMDIGQAAVVAREYVICVEAAEGTDQMLERAKGLRQWGGKWFGRRFGVLVKLPKPHQEIRIDMPAIGPRTVEKAADAGLNGICLATGNVLISDREETIELANKSGIFIIGVEPVKFLKDE